MRLYIVRHADPDYINDTITPEGHLEAQALAKRFQKEGLHKIYSSPLGRAKDTAKYTADLLNLELNIEHWTKELDDHVSLEPWGRMFTINVPGEIIRGCEPLPDHETWYKRGPFANTNFHNTYKKLREFSDEFLSRHGYERQGGRYLCKRPNRDKIAVFCHGGFGLTWLSILLELPPSLVWAGFWMPPSSVTTILFDERSNQWAVPRCIGFGDVSHLYAEGLPVRPSGIIANFE